METARFGVSADRLRALASTYGCTDQEYVSALVAMATDRSKGWDEDCRGVLPAGFLDLTAFCAGGGNNCVQAKREGAAIRLRESQRPGDEITMTPDQFAAFVQGVKAGEFDHLI